MGGATATAGSGTPYWVADFVRGAPVTSPPPVEPPTPDDGDGTVPIKVNVASGPHAYRPADGPLIFQFTLKGVREKNVMVRLEARGRWMMSLGPGNPPDGPYAETKTDDRPARPGDLPPWRLPGHPDRGHLPRQGPPAGGRSMNASDLKLLGYELEALEDKLMSELD